MRELKFRAWKNGFVFFNLLEDNDIDFYHFYCDGGDNIEQYTGLKDKNGKEIYEGDIVKYLSYQKEYTGQVVFDFVDDSEGYYVEKHYGWGIWRDDYNTSLGDYADDNMKCELIEVIGNIHESNMEELCPKE